MRMLAAVVTVISLSSGPLAQSRPAPVPTPDSVFGFAPGADYKLATYDQSIDYFKKLDAASDQHARWSKRARRSQGRTYVLRADLVAGRTWRSSIAIARSRSASPIPRA